MVTNFDTGQRMKWIELSGDIRAIPRLHQANCLCENSLKLNLEVFETKTFSLALD